MPRMGVSRREFLKLGTIGGILAATLCGPAKATAATAGPVKGGELRVGMYRVFDNLDPAAYWGPPETLATQLMFNTLVYLGNDMKFYPGLAKSWTISPDGTKYTFKLREDVKFHDGTPFSAEAVKFHFDRSVDPATRSKGARSLLGPYVSTDVLDSFTVRVNLKQPFAPFLDSLSQGYLGIPSPTAVKKWADKFEDHLVGTGPFRFVEWKRDSHLALERNPDYKWGPQFPGIKNQGPAYVDKLVFKFIPEVSTRDALMDAGKEVDIIAWPGPQSVGKWAKDKRMKLPQGISPGTSWLNFLNVRKPPTNELAVRQAINFALDKDAIVKAYYEGVATPAWNVLSSNTFGYDKRIGSMFYKYDPEKAKQLLDGAGWKLGSDGVRVKEGERLHLELFRGYPSEKEDYKELMAAQLAAVGFSTKLVPGSPTQRANAGSQGLHHVIFRQFETSDPHFLVDLFHSRGIGTYNWAMISDPKLDKMLEEQDTATDAEKRRSVLSAIQREIMEKAYVVPIYESIFVWVARANVQDLDLDARVWYPYLQDVWFSK